MPPASGHLASGSYGSRQYEDVLGLGYKRTEAYEAAQKTKF